MDFIFSALSSISMVGWVLIALLSLIIYLLFLIYFTPTSHYVRTRLKTMDIISTGTEKEKALQRSFTDRLVDEVKKYLQNKFEKDLKKGKYAPLALKLVQAGMDIDPVTHWTYKVLYCAGLATLGLVLGLSPLGETVPLPFLFIGAGALGFFLPDLQLKENIKKRQLKLKSSLPDFLDLLASTAPASNNFEDALLKVCSRVNNEISIEFKKALDEIHAGARTRKALSDMAIRCNVKEIDSLISSINQSMTLGVGLEKTLNQQALNMRKLKKQLAEIKANQASVLLILPSLFLLLVCLIMIAGPSVVSILSAGNVFGG